MKIETLSNPQIERFSRQILLKEVGSKGMKTLLNSKVTIVGAGGLGCPISQMLASLGVGNIKLIDKDCVELSNLPRQPLHFTEDVGRLKVESLGNKMKAINPEISLELIPEYLTQTNAERLLSGSDFVLDASDNIATKFLINDVCVHLNIPFSIAGVVQWYGQLITVIPGKTTCYRCIFSNIFEPEQGMTCSGAGAMATVPSLAGILQANEAVKVLLGLKPRFTNGLFNFDLLGNSFDHIRIHRDPNCKTCSHPEAPFYLTEKYEITPNGSQDSCEIQK